MDDKCADLRHSLERYVRALFLVCFSLLLVVLVVLVILVVLVVPRLILGFLGGAFRILSLPLV